MDGMVKYAGPSRPPLGDDEGDDEGDDAGSRLRGPGRWVSIAGEVRT